jgi:hypothetical protein
MDRYFLFAVAQNEEREGSIPKADILAGIRGEDSELAGAIYDIVTILLLVGGCTPPAQAPAWPAWYYDSPIFTPRPPMGGR